tara:strand:- start:12239 stop:12388 length:150 start_codon:yes stop_codon:yes gene_type:complete
MLKKHTVFILGKLTYISDTEERAIALAEDDLKYLHPKYNIEISGIKEEE